MTRVLDLFKEQFSGYAKKIVDRLFYVLDYQQDALEARIAALEAKVEALSRPLPNVQPVPDNLPAYTNNTLGRFPSDIQAAKDGDGE